MDSFDSCQSSFLKVKVSFGKLRKEIDLVTVFDAIVTSR